MSSPNLEYEEEFEFEDEFEAGAQGEFEDEAEFERLPEYEHETELEAEDELEWEDEGEGFSRRLRRATRGIGRFVRSQQPLLRAVAQQAAPLVGQAIGGPVGGMVARQVAANLEGEFEDESEYELEGEFEDELEDEFENQSAAAPTNATAEYMAAIAAQSTSPGQGEAMIGASVLASLSPADRATLRRALPHLVRAMGILYRVLRRRRGTRPAIRTIPAIVTRTAQQARSSSASGRPVSRTTIARIAASQTRNVLSRPRTCSSAIQRNVQAARRARQGAARRTY